MADPFVESNINFRFVANDVEQYLAMDAANQARYASIRILCQGRKPEHRLEVTVRRIAHFAAEAAVVAASLDYDPSEQISLMTSGHVVNAVNSGSATSSPGACRPCVPKCVRCSLGQHHETSRDWAQRARKRDPKEPPR